MPNLFIVGAAKAGTTSLHAYLAQHPSIFMSRVKEPHYFSRVEPLPEQRAIMRHVVRDEASYLELFAEAGDRAIVGESSPSYLWEPGTAGRLRRASPDASIIAILRDPVERAFSHYLMDVRSGVQRRAFLEALRRDLASPSTGWGVSHLYLELGCYGAQLERYFGAFARERILVLYFDRLVERPAPTLARVLGFLGLDPTGAERLDTARAHNPYAAARGAWARRLLGSGRVKDLGQLVPRAARHFVRDRVLSGRAPKPELPADARAFLEAHYRADAARLRALLGEAPPWERGEA